LSTPGALTPTSYIVLGLLAFAGEATPYELKAGHAGSVGSFWSVPHSQLYAEPDRLAEAGLVSVRREEGGRRRKHYALTDAGREALRAWLADAGTPPAEFREPALLKLFFGADPASVAPAQLAQHRARLERYEALRAVLPPTEGPALTLDAGIEHERVWIAYWERLAGGGTGWRAEDPPGGA
jgi:PadR family transcriptional regulator, regulatory protein AphA